jgi:hypothetical protein
MCLRARNQPSDYTLPGLLSCRRSLVGRVPEDTTPARPLQVDTRRLNTAWRHDK